MEVNAVDEGLLLKYVLIATGGVFVIFFAMPLLLATLAISYPSIAPTIFIVLAIVCVFVFTNKKSRVTIHLSSSSVMLRPYSPNPRQYSWKHARVREEFYSRKNGSGLRLRLVVDEMGKEQKYTVGRMVVGNFFGKFGTWSATPHYQEIVSLAKQNGCFEQKDPTGVWEKKWGKKYYDGAAEAWSKGEVKERKLFG